MNEPIRYTEVAAGVCIRAGGTYLLAQRPEGKVYAGYWEFPGGKLEPGECAGTALVRELQEELGITPTQFHPWITRTHHYEHARVRLRFFRIRRWEGELVCREFQQVAWQRPGHETVSPMLPA
ncbi:MAG: NUDIX domain-containing protein, partial [Verrucomicrobia bacterium]|nr:NUDIX domain-containing protein [Verrucomicrobiota bacterium]